MEEHSRAVEEKPSRPRKKKRALKDPSSSRSSSTTPSSSSSTKQGKLTRAAETKKVGCSRRGCQSCSATLVADCVALCCCPFAVVSFLALALIKVPCAMGRKCLGRMKVKSKEKNKKGVGRNEVEPSGGNDCGKRGSKNSGNEDEGVVKEGEMMEERGLCVGIVEADNVLLEMQEEGHLGFGRIS